MPLLQPFTKHLKFLKQMPYALLLLVCKSFNPEYSKRLLGIFSVDNCS